MATRTFTPLTARRAAPAPAAPVRRAPVAKAATPGVAAGLPRFAAPRPMAASGSMPVAVANRESSVPVVEARANRSFKAPPTTARRNISVRPDRAARTFERVGRPDSPWEKEAGKALGHLPERPRGGPPHPASPGTGRRPARPPTPRGCRPPAPRPRTRRSRAGARRSRTPASVRARPRSTLPTPSRCLSPSAHRSKPKSVSILVVCAS